MSNPYIRIAIWRENEKSTTFQAKMQNSDSDADNGDNVDDEVKDKEKSLAMLTKKFQKLMWGKFWNNSKKKKSSSKPQRRVNPLPILIYLRLIKI